MGSDRRKLRIGRFLLDVAGLAVIALCAHIGGTVAMVFSLLAASVLACAGYYQGTKDALAAKEG